MGTRRSRHNKGVKPLYKNIDRDSARFATWGILGEKPEREKPEPVIPRHVVAPRVSVDLEESVKRFLEERAKAKAPIIQTAARERRAAEFVNVSAFLSPAKEQEESSLTVSQDDILLQMFMERRLSGRQFRAGRIWQYDFEAATIQPNLSIDWSESVKGMHYQRCGDVTERQYNAMGRRRAFIEEAGSSVAAFLDFALGADRGRSHLLKLLAVDGDGLHAAVDSGLKTLCVHLGFDVRPDTDDQIRIRAWRKAA